MTSKSLPYSIGSDHLPGISKMVEEYGEVLQILGKIQGRGDLGIHWDGQNLKESLENEMSDVAAANHFLATKLQLNTPRMLERAEKKIKLFNRWHENIQAGRDSEDDGNT